MGFFLGIYDKDTIEAALGHQSEKSVRPEGSNAADPNQRLKLKQDWKNLAGQFSWRHQPSGPGKILGVS